MDGFALWPGGPVMVPSSSAEPVTTDSVLLGHFPTLTGVTRAMDLGCGSGVLGLILAARSERVRVDMVELDPGAAAACAENVTKNGLSGRLRVLNRDLRSLTEREVGKAQLIVSNPPYYPVGAGTAPGEGRRRAREERDCTLADLARTAFRLLGDGGRMALVYPCGRLVEALRTLSETGLEPKRLRLVQARPDSAPSVALIECRRGGRPGVRTEPVLILKNPDGTDTAEARHIYHLD